MKVMGLIVSDKNIFESCIENLFLTLWNTYATNQGFLDGTQYAKGR